MTPHVGCSWGEKVMIEKKNSRFVALQFITLLSWQAFITGLKMNGSAPPFRQKVSGGQQAINTRHVTSNQPLVLITITEPEAPLHGSSSSLGPCCLILPRTPVKKKCSKRTFSQLTSRTRAAAAVHQLFQLRPLTEAALSIEEASPHRSSCVD